MTAIVKALAASAKRKLEKGEALTEVDAISKAIRGVGITDKGNVKRLMSEVGTQYARNKFDEQRALQRRA
ncbi:MAG TPA: hypothetical protein VMR46_00725 [Candidatus Paceibacterota bacterium]|jgi:hypothetical protein|nr:hypothetical protein [Candidatus Paceibacterota bacterium]